MTKQPFFSIITCTKNSEKYLRENISSIEKQIFRNYEHIFIDGKSSDKTESIILEYQKRNKQNVKLYTHSPKGIANAMNFGINYANGTYIIHIHSDDSLYDSNVLEDAHAYLTKNPDLDWTYGIINVIEADGKTVGLFPKWLPFMIGWKYLLKLMNYIPHQAVFIRKSVFIKHGLFNEKLKAMMDQELWLRLNYRTNWNFFHRVISNYRVHKESVSSSVSNYHRNRTEYKKIRRKYLTSWIDIALAKITSYIVESRRHITTR